jgi:hypothetical protein
MHPLVAILQNVAIFERHQFLLDGPTLPTKDLLAVDFSDRHILRIEFLLILIALLVLLTLVVVEGQLAVWDEAIINGGVALGFCPFFNKRTSFFKSGEKPIIP